MTDEVRIDGSEIYLAPEGAPLPTPEELRRGADGWTLIGRVEDDGKVTDTRPPFVDVDELTRTTLMSRREALEYAATLERVYRAPLPALVTEPPVRFVNRAARRAAARSRR